MDIKELKAAVAARRRELSVARALARKAGQDAQREAEKGAGVDQMAEAVRVAEAALQDAVADGWPKLSGGWQWTEYGELRNGPKELRLVPFADGLTVEDEDACVEHWIPVEVLRAALEAIGQKEPTP